MQKMKIKHILKNLLLTTLIFFPLFSNQLFFLGSGLIGYNYEGSEDSAVYISYTTVVFISSVVGCSFVFFYNKLKKHEMNVIFCFFTFLFFSILFSLVSSYDFIFKELVLFIFFSLPGVISALIYYRFFSVYRYHGFVLFIIVLSLVLVIGFYKVFFSVKLFKDILLGGASYQFISYSASLMFGFCLLFLYLNSKKSDFNCYRFFCAILVVLAFVLPLIVIATGSKGASLLTVLYLMIYLFFIFLKRPLKFFLVGACVLFFMVYSFLFINDRGYKLIGLDRILIVFDGDKNFDSKSTGRLEYYYKFIELIEESPIYGYGLFVDNGYITNSHNIITMILMNFGLFFGSGFIFLKGLLLFNYLVGSKVNRIKKYLFFVFFLFSLISLMFSGSYLKNSFYWFSLTVLALYFFDRSKFNA